MSTRRLDDDPRLTAYALGELEPAEAREVEVLLTEDAQAQAAVQEIRATAARLTEALRNEASGPARSGEGRLSGAGSSSRQTGAQRDPIKVDFQARRRSWFPVLAAAASLAVVGLVSWGVLMRDRGERVDVAMRAAAPATSPAEQPGLSGEALREPGVFEKGGGAESPVTGVQTAVPIDDDSRRQVVAQLKTETIRAYNDRNYGQALNYADQMLNLDPTNEFAQAAQPLLQDRVLTMNQYGLANQQQQPQQNVPSPEGQRAQTLDKAQAAPAVLGDTMRRDGDVQDKLGVPRPTQETRGADSKVAAKQGADAPAETAPAGRQRAAAAEPAQRQQAEQLESRAAQKMGEAGKEAADEAPQPSRPPAQPGGGGGYAGGTGAGKEAEGGRPGREDRAEMEQDGAALLLPREVPADPTYAGVPEERLAGRFRQDFNTEQYDRIVDNAFKRALDEPLSTFSVDVDTASYANTRRFLTAGQLPPPDAVRIEEMVNYFDYNYTPPSTDSKDPFTASVAVSEAPWNAQNRLVRIGIKGKEIPAAERPQSNLVFLIDVSGSMDEPNKLPLVQRSMRMLAEQLDERDRVAIVVYAGGSGLVLASTSGAQRDYITGALDRLEAGGSTNGGEGIQLAYQVARQNFIQGGINRVILCTDGDFNIGITDRGQLTRLIEEEAKSSGGGVYLSILGFGMGNLKDATMEELTNKGEGNYGYIDTEFEARKLLVEQMQGTLQAIAKDVKIQVEFNPAEVGAYRLIGYENRILAKEDFNDDTKDAGDIGAGHEVTALYEVVPVEVQQKSNEEEVARLSAVLRKYEELQTLAGPTPDGRLPHEVEVAALRGQIDALNKSQPAPAVDALRFQRQPALTPEAASGDLLVVKLRYKSPDAPKEQGTSTLIEFPAKDEPRPFGEMDQDFQLAASAAGFGMLLRDSPYKGSLTWAGLDEMTRGIELLRLLKAAEPEPDPRVKELLLQFPQLQQRGEYERRLEFRDLVQRAGSLSGPRP